MICNAEACHSGVFTHIPPKHFSDLTLHFTANEQFSVMGLLREEQGV